MSVKIIIMRTVPIKVMESIRPPLMQLHTLALSQDGYISGESLTNIDNSEEKIVISCWRSKDDWDRFLAVPEVMKCHEVIDQKLDIKTMYQIYLGE